MVGFASELVPAPKWIPNKGVGTGAANEKSETAERKVMNRSMTPMERL